MLKLHAKISRCCLRSRKVLSGMYSSLWHKEFTAEQVTKKKNKPRTNPLVRSVTYLKASQSKKENMENNFIQWYTLALGYLTSQQIR